MRALGLGAVAGLALAATVAVAAPPFQEGPLVATTDVVELYSVALDELGELSVERASAIAVAPDDGTAWVLSGRRLRSFATDGSSLSDTLLPSDDDDGEEGAYDDDSGEHVALAVLTEGVAVALRRDLFLLSDAGDVLSEITLPQHAVAAGVHGVRLWIAHEKGIVGFEGGVPVANLSFGSKKVKDLSVAADGRLWVALGNEIRVLSSTGVLLRSRTIDADLVSATGDGAWITANSKLTRLDAALQTLATAPAFPQPSKIVSLSADSRDDSVFAAAKKRIRHIGPAGELLADAAFGGNAKVKAQHAVALRVDRVAPSLAFLQPSPGSCTSSRPVFLVAFQDAGSGPDPASLSFSTPAGPLATTCTFLEGQASCTPLSDLPEGMIAVSATLADLSSVPNVSAPAVVAFRVDSIAPSIQLSSSAPPALTNVALLSFAGTISEPASLSINGTPVPVSETLTWSFAASLVEGVIAFELVARDCRQAGHLTLTVTLDSTPPPPPDPSVFVSETQGGLVEVRGVAESGSRITLTNNATGFSASTFVDEFGEYVFLAFPAESGAPLSLVAVDAAGNTSQTTAASVPEAPGTGPADPSTIASVVDISVPADIGSAVRFLYEGPNRIQNGVAPGTIEDRRVLVLRGILKDAAGNGLAGARVALKDRDECGYTMTRADGAWDMACNGGGQLVVRMTKAGHLTVDRDVEQSDWRDYVWVGEARMLQVDGAYTDVVLSETSSLAVHQATVQTDADGTRRATVLVPFGTTATMTLPDGTIQPLPGGRLRATEFTVGPAGPLSMPASLPKLSHYTYAVEMTFDEAVALEASDVTFSQPVVLYVENFIAGGLPVGTDVPLGIYSREKAQWEPVPDGRIVRILSIGESGFADLDLDGAGIAASAEELETLGITLDEREALAGLFNVGDSFSRLQFPHFSPGDPNYPFIVNGKYPNMTASDAPDKDCPLTGSIIGCQSQRLGEVIPLVGTGVSMAYDSTRIPGRKSSIEIPLTDGSPIPSSLLEVLLSVDIAGKHFERSFTPSANMIHRFNWDGRDAYGRPVQGGAVAHVQIGYKFRSSYTVRSSSLDGSTRPGLFGEPGILLTTLSPTRLGSDPVLTQEYDVHIPAWDARAFGLGGWDLTGHHHYNPNERAVYYSDGSRRKAVGPELHRFAGQPASANTSGDGGPASAALLSFPWKLRVAPDGSVFLTSDHRVRRIRPDGIIETVAGSTTAGFAGDGGPALLARMSFPDAIAFGPDGSFFVADSGNRRIRKVSADGIITTVAGNGSSGFSGDGGPATSAAIGSNLNDVDVGPDGSIYIVQTNEHRVRRVRPDGIVTTFAGGGILPGTDIGDGRPATRAELLFPRGVFVSPDGRVLIADSNQHRIRSVDTSGVITTFAGTGTRGHTGDGGPASLARLSTPISVARAPDGSFYVAEQGGWVRRIGADGIITSIAGNGAPTCNGFGGASLGSGVFSPRGIDVAPDGQVFVSDIECHTVLQVGESMPGYSASEIAVPHESGSAIDVFSASGRHLRTLDALTGNIRAQFNYDAAGRLASVRDANANELVIERNASGAPTAIVAPGGQRATLALDGSGFLSRVTNPAGEEYRLTHGTTGLLTGLRTPRLHDSEFTYDAYGRLERDEDPAGGSTSLARSTANGEFTVTATSRLGRTRSYRFESENGETISTNTAPSGTQTSSTNKLDTESTTTSPDGTEVLTFLGADPRFGMRGAFARETRVFTPAGNALIMERTRTVGFNDPASQTRLTDQIDEVRVNGNTWRTAFDATDALLPKVTTTSPEGRISVTTLDAQSRPILVEVADLAPLSIHYNARGRVDRVTAGVGAEARTAGFAYDLANRLVTAVDPLGRAVTFEHDGADRVTSQLHVADGREIQATYDAAGNVATLTPPDRPAHGFAYSSVDQESRYSPPPVAESGTTVTDYSYNSDRQLTQVTRPDAEVIVSAYDASTGKLTTLTHSRGTITAGYSSATGQLTSLGESGGETLAFAWDGFLPVSETWGGTVPGTVSRTFNDDFRLASETVNGGFAASYSYDRDGAVRVAGEISLARDSQSGLLTGSTLGGVTEAREHSAFGEPSRIEFSALGAPIFETLFQRDRLGRITQKTETLDGVTTVTDIGYDLAGRLESVTVDGALSATYTWDRNGNRLAAETDAGTAFASFDAQDRMLSHGDGTFGYSAAGELTTRTNADGTTAYQYDALGSLRRVDLPDGQVIEYLVDGRNRRVGKKVYGILVQGFLYRDQLEPVAELDGAGNVVSRFVYGSKAHVPDYMVKGGTTYRIVSDHLGSPRLVIDAATGAIAQRMDFDEWGNVTLDTAPGLQPFGFAGGILDAHTGLTRFGARDYDPRVGRWTAKDAAGLGAAAGMMFVYAMNDPVNLIDRTGRTSEDIDKAIGDLESIYEVDFGLVFVVPAGPLVQGGNHGVTWPTNPLTTPLNPMGKLFWPTGVIFLHDRYFDVLDCEGKAELSNTLLHEYRHLQSGVEATAADKLIGLVGWPFGLSAPLHDKIADEGDNEEARCKCP